MQLFQSLCGFTDPSLVSCGRFFPKGGAKTGLDQLKFIADRHASVELDSSLYFIPSLKNIRSWCENTPPGFLFHVKAYGLLCSRQVQHSALPWSVKELVAGEKTSEEFGETKETEKQQHKDKRVLWSAMSADAKDKVWEVFNQTLIEFEKYNKLGVVLFQFHTTFGVSDGNKAWLKELRTRTRNGARISFEFRSRTWFETPQQVAELAALCKELREYGPTSICIADELTSEMPRFFSGIGAGPPNEAVASPGDPDEASLRHLMPLAVVDTDVDFVYIRLHRREGDYRILSDGERRAWYRRLQRIASSWTQRPLQVFFNWGTAHEDHAIQNMKLLEEEIERRSAAQSPNSSIAITFVDAAWRAAHAEKQSIAHFFKMQAQSSPVAGVSSAVSSSKPSTCADSKQPIKSSPMAKFLASATAVDVASPGASKRKTPDTSATGGPASPGQTRTTKRSPKRAAKVTKPGAQRGIAAFFGPSTST